MARLHEALTEKLECAALSEMLRRKRLEQGIVVEGHVPPAPMDDEEYQRVLSIWRDEGEFQKWIRGAP